MWQRHGVLNELLAPEHQEAVTSLLLAGSRDLPITVPCAVLSKGASGTGSKVVVRVRRVQGASLALDCGQWWRGAPTAAVYMDYRQVRRCRRGGGRRCNVAAMHVGRSRLAPKYILPAASCPPFWTAAAAARQ